MIVDLVLLAVLFIIIVCAAILMSEGKAGWGWMIFIAFVIVMNVTSHSEPSLRFEKVTKTQDRLIQAD